MPGLVKLLMTAVGARVREGAPLLVLEAMKMEHTLCSPRDGVIAALHVNVGEHVGDGTRLLDLEPADG